MNYKAYIYMCLMNVVLCILMPSAFNQVTAQVAGQKPEGTLQPQLFIEPDKAYEQEKENSDNKVTSGVMLFYAKNLPAVEASLNSARPYFLTLRATSLIDIAIKGMYQPAANLENTPCDMMVADGFDKTSLPDLDADFNKELLKFMKPELISEVFYCMAYLGIQASASDFYIFYAAPFKNELLALQTSKLQGRELAWLIANDFQQSVCNRNPIIHLSKEMQQKMQNRQDKLNN